MSKVVRVGAGCWEWIGTFDAYGYAMFAIKRQNRKAARVSFALFKGPFDKDKLVCHHCDNRGCVNPEHLFLGTAADNTADMVAKGRAVGNKNYFRMYPEKIKRGEDNPNAKIKSSDVIEIMALSESGIGQRELGRRYGISKTHVKRIITGKAWSQITHLR